MATGYLVVRRLQGKAPEFLRLVGAFQYQQWSDTPRSGQLFTLAKASQAAAGFGGEMIPFDGQDIGDVMRRIAELFPDPAPATQPSPYGMTTPDSWGRVYAAVESAPFTKVEPPTRPEGRRSRAINMNEVFGKYACELRPFAVKPPSEEQTARMRKLFWDQVDAMMKQREQALVKQVNALYLDTASPEELDEKAAYRIGVDMAKGADETMVLVWNGKRRATADKITFDFDVEPEEKKP